MIEERIKAVISWRDNPNNSTEFPEVVSGCNKTYLYLKGIVTCNDLVTIVDKVNEHYSSLNSIKRVLWDNGDFIQRGSI
jgi:hypothetical protein